MLTIPQHFVTEFGTNWEFLVQQKPSMLKGCVTPAMVNGEKKSFNQLGQMSMSRVTSRIDKTRISELGSDKRWLSSYPYDVANLFDEWDQDFLGNVVLPTSETVQAHAFAYNRACDQVIIDAALGTAYSGEDGTTASTFDANQIIAANYGGANSGLTIAKLIAIKGLFGKNNIDESEEIYFVHSQKQLDDLLATTQATSSDYAAVKALVDGTITRFMGMTWKRTELLPKDGNDLRTCFAFVKSGIKFSDVGRKVHMDVRSDLQHALQIRSVAKLGAVRMEEARVAQVICDESP
jgi:hypothetical protein